MRIHCIHISIPVLCIEYVQERDQLIHTYIGNDPHTFYINPDVSWNNQKSSQQNRMFRPCRPSSATYNLIRSNEELAISTYMIG